jgi:predicted dienelactone hydrolase
MTISIARSLRPSLLRFYRLLLIASSLSSPSAASATEAGWRQITVPVSPNTEAIQVALYYPTQAPAKAIAMGPFTVRAAIQAPPDAKFKGLIILSHGTGGSELGHSSLAEALAQHGYLVAALRHPGDNWQDHSVWQRPPGAFFIERPQQVSRVIDALLRDPEWKDRIATDVGGPRIGAVGHSAGGYTVIALAGGQPDLSRIVEHCQSYRADDPIFCGMGRTGQTPAQPAIPIPPLADKRVRAVVAMAPAGVFFTADSLASIRISVAVYAAELDRWLVPRFHAEWIAKNIPGAEFHEVHNAWHFAFMDTPSSPIATLDGDAAADPPGFDRQALLKQLQVDLPAVFDKAFSE